MKKIIPIVLTIIFVLLSLSSCKKNDVEGVKKLQSEYFILLYDLYETTANSYSAYASYTIKKDVFLETLDKIIPVFNQVEDAFLEEELYMKNNSDKEANIINIELMKIRSSISRLLKKGYNDGNSIDQENALFAIFEEKEILTFSFNKVVDILN